MEKAKSKQSIHTSTRLQQAFNNGIPANSEELPACQCSQCRDAGILGPWLSWTRFKSHLWFGPILWLIWTIVDCLGGCEKNVCQADCTSCSECKKNWQTITRPLTAISVVTGTVMMWKHRQLLSCLNHI